MSQVQGSEPLGTARALVTSPLPLEDQAGEGDGRNPAQQAE